MLVADQRLLSSREAHISRARVHEDRETPARSHPYGICVMVSILESLSTLQFSTITLGIEGFTRPLTIHPSPNDWTVASS